MAKYIKKIDEQMAAPAPTREKEKERTTVPTKPGTTPRRPSPIRRSKPSVKPKPKASAEDVYSRFIEELRAAKGEIEFDIQKLKDKYGVSESEVVKGFAQFLYEASLEDNPGLPDGYKGDVERRAREDNSRTRQELGRKIPQFMGIVQNALSMQRGNEQQLEELAERAIRELYGSILDGVKLDIKFPEDRGEIPDEMSDSEFEPPQDQDPEVLEDPEIIGEIQKRKLSNAITQGEAKNTKLILNLPVIKDGIIDIMGQEDGEKFVGLLNEITKIATFFDWDIPLEVQKEMWKNPSGFSGSVSVDWEQPESEEEQEDMQRSAEDIIADIESGDDILDTEAEELFDDMQPTIKARGIDFAMLIHEAVKGIYELIAAAGIPEDEEVAQTVIMNTDTLADEIEDLRYGPYIAADLRDFINEFSEASRIENLREHFFGKLMAMPAADFLELVKNILMGSDRARTEAQSIIDEISQELSDYDMEQAFGGDDEDYGDDNDLEDYNLPTSSDEGDEVAGNYEETLSQSEIQALIDNALDNGNFEEVERLAKYLKESLANSILSYSDYKSLNESLKAAKQYYLKSVKDDFLKKKSEVLGDLRGEDDIQYDEETGEEIPVEDPNELTPDDTAQLLGDRDFKFIMDLVKTSPNYAVPFVKFKYDQGANLDDLASIFEIITDQSNKGLIKDLPLGSVEAYSKLGSDSEVPGYELLGDDMTKLIARKEGMWIVKNLTRNAGIRDNTGRIIPGKQPTDQKELYKNAPRELKDELIDTASQFKAEGFDIPGFKRVISKYTSLESIIDSMKVKINNSGTDMAQNIKQHNEEFPGTSVLWEGQDKFLVIYRSSWTLGKFCGFTEWCNRPSTGPYQVTSGGGMSGRFHSYASDGKVQFAMWDYTKDRTDPMRLVGFTVDNNGKITAAADVPNNYNETPRKIGGQELSLSNALDYFEVPAESKQFIMDSLEGESNLMREVGPIYDALESGTMGEAKFFKMIEDSRVNSLRAEFGDSTGGAVSALASRVIANHIADNADSSKVRTARTKLWDIIMKHGLKSGNFVSLFKIIFENSDYMTSENIDKIIATNSQFKKNSEALLKLATSPRKADQQRVKAAAEKAGKTLDTVINNASKTIKAIDKVNGTYLNAMKNSLTNN